MFKQPRYVPPQNPRAISQKPLAMTGVLQNLINPIPRPIRNPIQPKLNNPDINPKEIGKIDKNIKKNESPSSQNILSFETDEQQQQQQPSSHQMKSPILQSDNISPIVNLNLTDDNELLPSEIPLDPQHSMISKNPEYVPEYEKINKSLEELKKAQDAADQNQGFNIELATNYKKLPEDEKGPINIENEWSQKNQELIITDNNINVNDEKDHIQHQEIDLISSEPIENENLSNQRNLQGLELMTTTTDNMVSNKGYNNDHNNQQDVDGRIEKALDMRLNPEDQNNYENDNDEDEDSNDDHGEDYDNDNGDNHDDMINPRIKSPLNKENKNELLIDDNELLSDEDILDFYRKLDPNNIIGQEIEWKLRYKQLELELNKEKSKNQDIQAELDHFREENTCLLIRIKEYESIILCSEQKIKENNEKEHLDKEILLCKNNIKKYEEENYHLKDHFNYISNENSKFKENTDQLINSLKAELEILKDELNHNNQYHKKFKNSQEELHILNERYIMLEKENHRLNEILQSLQEKNISYDNSIKSKDNDKPKVESLTLGIEKDVQKIGLSSPSQLDIKEEKQKHYEIEHEQKEEEKGHEQELKREVEQTKENINLFNLDKIIQSEFENRNQDISKTHSPPLIIPSTKSVDNANDNQQPHFQEIQQKPEDKTQVVLVKDHNIQSQHNTKQNQEQHMDDFSKPSYVTSSDKDHDRHPINSEPNSHQITSIEDIKPPISSNLNTGPSSSLMKPGVIHKHIPIAHNANRQKPIVIKAFGNNPSSSLFESNPENVPNTSVEVNTQQNPDTITTIKEPKATTIMNESQDNLKNSVGKDTASSPIENQKNIPELKSEEPNASIKQVQTQQRTNVRGVQNIPSKPIVKKLANNLFANDNTDEAFFNSLSSNPKSQFSKNPLPEESNPLKRKPNLPLKNDNLNILASFDESKSDIHTPYNPSQTGIQKIDSAASLHSVISTKTEGDRSMPIRQMPIMVKKSINAMPKNLFD